MSKLQQLKERAFQNPEVRYEYDALAEEFEFIDTLLKIRPSSVMKHHNKRKVRR